MRDPRHDILFEPIKIGPVTTKNRFYQVPHCTGMGWRRPRSLAAMRGVKAEGGWGVVCTEYCSIHPAFDADSFAQAALWDDNDIRANGLMCDAVHEHGALAGVELWFGGANLGTRLPSLGLRNSPNREGGASIQGQPRKMDKQDIRNLRHWHADAAKRAVKAGFDIVYVYATHGYLMSDFLDTSFNNRTDEYGGSLKNRTRIVRELIEETFDAVAGKAAVATRFSVELTDPETYDAFAQMADMPDLWDLTVPDYGVEMGASRFVKEASFVDSIAHAKSMTSKPVVAVGRFTSPDTMAEVIKNGHQDMIGAARPSIADPFLPTKISEGRSEDIRECIGCNICYAQDSLGVPVRCTQNPTMGEEWRLGWHPERAGRSENSASVLVVGAGPAGLEAARVLGERGHKVMLAEAERTLGGRVTRESRLPGLAEWARVRDWRVGQIEKLDSVKVFPESRMKAEDIFELNVDHVLVATGSKWAEDTIGRHSVNGFETSGPGMVLGAEAVLSGQVLNADHVVIYDDDHYYLGSVMALELRKKGHAVTLVTPAGRPCEFGFYTDEMYSSNARLFEAGVKIVANHLIVGAERGAATTECVITGARGRFECDLIIPVTRRIPFLDLYDDLMHKNDGSIRSINKIGDAEAPGTIATAVYSGHRYAMTLESDFDLTSAYSKRENFF